MVLKRRIRKSSWKLSLKQLPHSIFYVVGAQKINWSNPTGFEENTITKIVSENNLIFKEFWYKQRHANMVEE